MNLGLRNSAFAALRSVRENSVVHVLILLVIVWAVVPGLLSTIV